MTSTDIFLSNYKSPFYDSIFKPFFNRESLEDTASSCIDTDDCGPMISQKEIFSYDLKDYVLSPIDNSKSFICDLADSITMLVITPFSILIDMYSVCAKKISFSTSLKNIYSIPTFMIAYSINIAIIIPINLAYKVIEAVQTAAGFIAWHTGEFLVRQVKSIFNKSSENKFSVLSHNNDHRKTVYNSLGITLLAGAALFVNILPVQLAALPILAGSLYGTINNLFTVKKCPEYFNLKYKFNGERLENHAIKTNNILIKSFVTGCYSTASLAKVAAIFIAAAGAAPFTAAIIPISYVASMIGAISVISFVASSIFSKIAERNIQKNIQEYAKLIGAEITEQDLEKNWYVFKYLHEKEMKQTLANIKNEEKKQQLLRRLKYIDNYIQKYSTALPTGQFGDRMTLIDLGGQTRMPLKYLAPWHSTAVRNGTGFVVMSTGAIIATAATVALRILVL